MLTFIRVEGLATSIPSCCPWLTGGWPRQFFGRHNIWKGGRGKRTHGKGCTYIFVCGNGSFNAKENEMSNANFHFLRLLGVKDLCAWFSLALFAALTGWFSVTLSLYLSGLLYSLFWFPEWLFDLLLFSLARFGSHLLRRPLLCFSTSKLYSKEFTYSGRISNEMQ